MIKKWIKKIINEILQDEYYISGDIGIQETEIMVIKYSYRLNKFEVISDNRIRKTPLATIENEIRTIIGKANTEYKRVGGMALDYPLQAKEVFGNIR